jgi:DNA modification methylase
MARGIIAAPARGDQAFREIQLLEQAASYLAECQDLDEVKGLRDKAEALRLYQKKIGDSQRSQNAAAEIKIRAERRMGELIKATHGQGTHGGDRRSSSTVKLEISRGMSHRVQAIAAVPVERFEATISEAKRANRELTSREMIRIGKTEQRTRRKRQELEDRARARATHPGGPTWGVRRGDCVAELERIEEGSARLVFADPPYNLGMDYGDDFDDRMAPADYLAWCTRWIAAAARVLTPDGSLWILNDWEWLWDIKPLAERAGLHLRQPLVWYETFGEGHPQPRQFARCSRPLLWLVRDPGRFVFDVEGIRVRSVRQELGDGRADPGGKVPDDIWIFPRLAGTHRERMPDVPTQLPVELVRRVVGYASEPGDLVIDPFCGSGTTGAACLSLGRRFLGIELSERFAELSRQRLAGLA